VLVALNQRLVFMPLLWPENR
jgi:hypothetical protein